MTLGLRSKMMNELKYSRNCLKIPRFKAEAILNGNFPPDLPLLNHIAQELEVEVDWLLGKEGGKSN